MASPKSINISNNVGHWEVEFDGGILTIDNSIVLWLQDNCEPEEWFLQNLRKIGFTTRETAFLCHLRFA